MDDFIDVLTDVLSGQAQQTSRAQLTMVLAATGATGSAHAATKAQVDMVLTAQVATRQALANLAGCGSASFG